MCKQLSVGVVVALATILAGSFSVASATTRLLSFNADLLVQGVISDGGVELDSISESKSLGVDLTDAATPPHLDVELPWSMDSSTAMSIEGRVAADYDFAHGSYGIPLDSPTVFLDWFTSAMYARHDATVPVVNNVVAFDIRMQSKLSLAFELGEVIHPFNQISGSSEYANQYWYYPHQELAVTWTLTKPDGSILESTTPLTFFPPTGLSFEEGTYNLSIETQSRIFGLQNPPWYPTGEGVGQNVYAGTYFAVDQVVPEPWSGFQACCAFLSLIPRLRGSR